MKSKFQKLSDAELLAYSPSSDAEFEDYQAEAGFREWCKENEEDPSTGEAREAYEEESNSDGWDDMDEDEKAGWEDNMNKN